MNDQGDVQKLSPVEGFKAASNYLRGPILDELTDGSDHFGKASIQLLKHHGTYQQDDRDSRGKDGKQFSFAGGDNTHFRSSDQRAVPY